MTKEHNDKIIYTVAEKLGGLYVQQISIKDWTVIFSGHSYY